MKLSVLLLALGTSLASAGTPTLAGPAKEYCTEVSQIGFDVAFLVGTTNVPNIMKALEKYQKVSVNTKYQIINFVITPPTSAPQDAKVKLYESCMQVYTHQS